MIKTVYDFKSANDIQSNEVTDSDLSITHQ